MIRFDAPQRLMVRMGLCLAIHAGVALSFPLAPARADEAVQTRAALISDGARLVFDWPAPVSFTTTLAGDRLTISFERPLAATFDTIVQSLPDHIRAVDITGGGQNVVVTLAQPAHVRSFAQGDLVVVDLKPLNTGEAPTVVAEQAEPQEAQTAEAAPPPPADEAPAQTAEPQQAEPATPAPPVMVDGVLSVRYGLHDAYDRIVFDWPERVPYTVTNEGGWVTISFAADAEIDIDRLAGRLPERRIRLIDVSNGSSGLQLVLAVSPGARVRDFYNFTKTVIDIYRDPNNGAPATAPASPDLMAAAEETAGEAETNEPTVAETAESPSTTEPADAGDVVTTEPEALEEPDSQLAEVDEPEPAEEPDSGIRNQLASLPPSLGHQAGSNASQPGPVQQEAAPPSADADPADPPQAAEQEDLHGAAEPSAPTVPEVPPTRGAVIPPETTHVPEPAEAEVENHATSVDDEVGTAEPPEEPEAAEHAEPEHAEQGLPAPTHDDAAVETAEHDTPDDAPHGERAGSARLDVVVIEGDFEALMRLRWSEPVRAAVIRRGGQIWIAFDRHAEDFDLAAIESGAGELYSDPKVIDSDGGLVFGVHVGDEVEPRVTAAGNTWYVQMRPRRSESAVALTPERFEDPALGPAIAFVAADGDAPSLDPGTPLEFLDPEVGDRIIVVPLGAPSTGLAEAASFVQFSAIVSAQGLAFERLSDDVVVRSGDDRVEVVASGGLILSDDQAWRGTGGVNRGPDHAVQEHGTGDHGGPADHAAPAQHAEVEPSHAGDSDHGAADPGTPLRGGGMGDFRLFDQVPWRDESAGRFANVYRDMQNAAAAAVGEDARAEARAAFARFLFGYDQFRDAGSVLRMIQTDTPRRFQGDASLIALRGAVSYLNGDLTQALEDFSDIRLRPSGEAQYWRAAVLQALGRTEEAEAAYGSQAVAPDWYEPSLRIPLALASVDAALASSNTARAAEVLDDLPYFGLEDELAGEIALRRAETAWRAGNHEDADHEWTDLIDGDVDGLAARAVFDRTVAYYEAGHLTPAEAAAALDDIRFDWRGDRFEYRLLRELAEFQFAAGDYRSGFRTLKRTRVLFNDDADRMDVDARLQSAFTSLFGPEPPASVSPVTAIALYSEFEELAPSGAELDAMLRRLAGRLVSIDLHGEAAKVLHNQLLPHTEGAARGELGRDLAVLYLADDQPRDAIEVLAQTRARGFGDVVDAQRRQLHASAELALQNYEAALDALEEDTSRSANMLRAEIHWRQGDWAAAAADFGKLVEGGAFTWPPQPAAAAATEPMPATDMAMAGLMSAEEAAALDAPDGDLTDLASPAGPAAEFTPVSAPLGDFAAEQTLNWAMALTYADDQPGLAYLRQRYGPAMADTHYADMFRLLVADDIGPITSVADFGRIGPNIDMFERFLGGYRERLAAELADPVVAETEVEEADAELGQAEG